MDTREIGKQLDGGSNIYDVNIPLKLYPLSSPFMLNGWLVSMIIFVTTDTWLSNRLTEALEILTFQLSRLNGQYQGSKHGFNVWFLRKRTFFVLEGITISWFCKD